MRAVLALALLGGLALADIARAEPPLTAAEFDALTQGRTMTWSEQGSAYGVEQYLPGRKVRWTFIGDECKDGSWYPDGTAICFLYDGDSNPKCWEVTRSGADLLARFTSSPPEADPVVVSETHEILACFGPKVGV